MIEVIEMYIKVLAGITTFIFFMVLLVSVVSAYALP